jgi:protein gp37
MQKTMISWSQFSWNVLRGCSLASPGCKNCYAMRLASKFASAKSGPTPFKGFAYMEDGEPRWTGKVATLPDKLLEPFSLKPPQRVFVNSMSDMFHEEVPTRFLYQMFGVMALCPELVFQGLTKREKRLSSFTNDPETPAGIEREMERIAAWPKVRKLRGVDGSLFSQSAKLEWPLANVHLGVSIENDVWAARRLPVLRKATAAVRWISAEPLLSCLGEIDLTGVHWVVIGGESGPGYRPMDMAWARAIRDQCVKQHVALFVKQDAAPITETRKYLVEEDGRCMEWHQYPGLFTAPEMVEPDNLKYHLKTFPQAKAIYG